MRGDEGPRSLRCVADFDFDSALRRTVSLRLTALLERRGLSQKQLAHASGVSHSCISRYVSGKRTVTTDALVRIALALDVDVSWMLGLRGPSRLRNAPPQYAEARVGETAQSGRRKEEGML